MKILKKFFIFIAFLLISIISEAETTDTIFWNCNYKLVVTDFRGSQKTDSTHAAISYCVIGLHISYNEFGSPTFNTYCYFLKDSSWINIKGLDSSLVKHEQGHFDIAAIYAKMLKESLTAHKFKNATFDKEVDSIYNDISMKLDAMQQQYDLETKFHMNNAKQIQWNKKISALLAKHK